LGLISISLRGWIEPAATDFLMMSVTKGLSVSMPTGLGRDFW
jgi:hypothetical protein